MLQALALQPSMDLMRTISRDDRRAQERAEPSLGCEYRFRLSMHVKKLSYPGTLPLQNVQVTKITGLGQKRKHGKSCSRKRRINTGIGQTEVANCVLPGHIRIIRPTEDITISYLPVVSDDIVRNHFCMMKAEAMGVHCHRQMQCRLQESMMCGGCDILCCFTGLTGLDLQGLQGGR